MLLDLATGTQPHPSVHERVNKSSTFRDGVFTFQLGYSSLSRVEVPVACVDEWIRHLHFKIHSYRPSELPDSPASGSKVAVWNNDRLIMASPVSVSPTDDAVDVLRKTLHVRGDNYVWHLPIGKKGKGRMLVSEAKEIINAVRHFVAWNT